MCGPSDNVSIKYYTEPVGQFCEVQPINCKCVGQILPMCGPIFLFFFGVRGGGLNLREIDSGHIFGNFTNMTIHLRNSNFSEERGQTIP